MCCDSIWKLPAQTDDSPRFRRLLATDARAMGELEKVCFALPWSHEQCLGALGQKAFAAFGLWRGQSLLAYISLYRHPDEFEILNLAVIPEERGKGHGKRILTILLQTARNMGMQKVVLEVRESNARAIGLYEKCGFEKCGVRKKYYPDTGENAYIYCNSLN